MPGTKEGVVGCMVCPMMKPRGMVIQKPTIGTPIDTGSACMHSFCTKLAQED